jgi:hypothetical protein
LRLIAQYTRDKLGELQLHEVNAELIHKLKILATYAGSADSGDGEE